MRRFRKPVMVKAIREFESPPLRFWKNVVGFTTHRRASQRRGGVALGKTAMIFNGFPRVFEFDRECLFADQPVRTGYFQEISLLLDFAVQNCGKMASLQGFNEADGRFEPRGFVSPSLPLDLTLDG